MIKLAIKCETKIEGLKKELVDKAVQAIKWHFFVPECPDIIIVKFEEILNDLLEYDDQ